MKTFFISVAAVICMSCMENYDEVFENTVITNTKVTKDDGSSSFYKVCSSIIDVHRELDYFRDLLTEGQLKKIDTKSYDIDTAVEIIYTWWLNDRTFEVMCEWPEYDDFVVSLPEKYRTMYDFQFEL